MTTTFVRTESFSQFGPFHALLGVTVAVQIAEVPVVAGRLLVSGQLHGGLATAALVGGTVAFVLAWRRGWEIGHRPGSVYSRSWQWKWLALAYVPIIVAAALADRGSYFHRFLGHEGDDFLFGLQIAEASFVLALGYSTRTNIGIAVGSTVVLVVGTALAQQHFGDLSNVVQTAGRWVPWAIGSVLFSPVVAGQLAQMSATFDAAIDEEVRRRAGDAVKAGLADTVAGDVDDIEETVKETVEELAAKLQSEGGGQGARAAELLRVRAAELSPASDDFQGALEDTIRNLVIDRDFISARPRVFVTGRGVLDSAEERWVETILETALANIRRHADARLALIRVSYDGSSVVVEVIDDPEVQDPARSMSRTGSQGSLGQLREYTATLGGDVHRTRPRTFGSILRAEITRFAE